MGDRVLVTGAGGPAGVNVIRALRSSGAFVVAVDADPRAVGSWLADASGVVPYGSDPRFCTQLVDVATRHGVDVVIPTVAEELVALAAVEAELREAGIVTWVPSPDAVTRCTDKLAFWHALAAAGVAAPATALGGEPAPPGPWVVKPRDGRGSRHVHLAETVEELDFYVARTPSPIVQTRVHGREFTADVLLDRDGTLAGGAARWRVETKAGISTKGTTFALAEVAAACEGATRAVGLTGAANVQGFVTESGEVVVVEINPRFSGALALSLHAGADLVGQYVRGARGLPLERDRLVAEPGVCMTRHFEEVFYRCA